MMIYPLTLKEERMVRWLLRIVPATGAALVLLLGALSVAAATS